MAKKFGLFLFKGGIALSVIYMLGWIYASSNPQDYYGIISFKEAFTIGMIPTIIGAICAALFSL